MKKRVVAKCSKCLTGKKTYDLDNKEPMCPYLHSYANRRCSFYVPLNDGKSGFVKKIILKILSSLI